MPVHDWARVDAGTFHDFHTTWLAGIKVALNAGVLPSDYYALVEQVATRMQTDVLTLHAPAVPGQAGSPTGLALSEAAPAVRLRARPAPTKARAPRLRRGRNLVVRHITGHRVVAVLEIVSPANKDRRASVRERVDKVEQLLEAGIHVLLIDLLRPSRHDPQGMHGAVWSRLSAGEYHAPADEPLTLASYRWDGAEAETFVEPVGLGRPLRDMPLFLEREHSINVPLESTYMQAYAGVPAFWRRVLESSDGGA